MKEGLFKIKYRFWYSGYVGRFQKSFKKPLDNSVDKFLLFLFEFQLILKKVVYLMLRRIK